MLALKPTAAIAGLNSDACSYRSGTKCQLYLQIIDELQLQHTGKLCNTVNRTTTCDKLCKPSHHRPCQY
jgi:hypothetical protein